MANVEIDDSDFRNKVKQFEWKIREYTQKGVNAISEEVLRLSQFEVPHDTGALQNSGHVEYGNDLTSVVGYNKVYAARLHEHPEYRFQKGRKGKYLEDPIKNNLIIFRKYMVDFIKKATI